MAIDISNLSTPDEALELSNVMLHLASIALERFQLLAQGAVGRAPDAPRGRAPGRPGRDETQRADVAAWQAAVDAAKTLRARHQSAPRGTVH